MATDNRPKIPAVVQIPAGYRRAKPSEITPKVQAFARQALTSARPIGKRQAARIDGKQFEAITEWHYDDHVPNPDKSNKPWWHPGISIIVPITPVPEAKLSSASKAQPKKLATGQQVVAYDPLARGGSLDLTTLMENADKKVV